MENRTTFAKEHSWTDSGSGEDDTSTGARSFEESEGSEHESEGEEHSSKEEDGINNNTKVPEYKRLRQENIKKNSIKQQELGVLNLAASQKSLAMTTEATRGKGKRSSGQKAMATRIPCASNQKKRRNIVRYVAYTLNLCYLVFGVKSSSMAGTDGDDGSIGPHVQSVLCEVANLSHDEVLQVFKDIATFPPVCVAVLNKTTAILTNVLEESRADSKRVWMSHVGGVSD